MTATGWDCENRLRTIQVHGGSVVTNTYDADGLRRKREEGEETILYMWDGQRLLRESDESYVTQALYSAALGDYGPMISQYRASGGTRLLHPNAQGTITNTTNTTGSSVDSYIHDAFGEPISVTGYSVNPHRYIGQEGYQTEPTLGLDYVRARWYRPGTGSWLSADPVPSEPRYQYVGGRPMVATDGGGRIDPLADEMTELLRMQMQEEYNRWRTVKPPPSVAVPVDRVQSTLLNPWWPWPHGISLQDIIAASGVDRLGRVCILDLKSGLTLYKGESQDLPDTLRVIAHDLKLPIADVSTFYPVPGLETLEWGVPDNETIGLQRLDVTEAGAQELASCETIFLIGHGYRSGDPPAFATATEEGGATVRATAWAVQLPTRAEVLADMDKRGWGYWPVEDEAGVTRTVGYKFPRARLAVIQVCGQASYYNWVHWIAAFPPGTKVVGWESVCAPKPSLPADVGRKEKVLRAWYGYDRHFVWLMEWPWPERLEWLDRNP